jgi:hypothetical protein
VPVDKGADSPCCLWGLLRWQSRCAIGCEGLAAALSCAARLGVLKLHRLVVQQRLGASLGTMTWLLQVEVVDSCA